MNKLKLINHAEEVTEYLTNLQWNHKFSDITVHCSNGKKIKSHCAILSCMSSFLKKLLSSLEEPVLLLPDVRLHHFKGLLCLLYTGVSNVFKR